MGLRDEIKQAAPFASMKEELLLNLQRTASGLTHDLEQVLRPYGLSATQYNVLRILRGAGETGLCQYEIRGRLVAQVPDVPRILERMERAGWLRRLRGQPDRRMVMASLTESGLALAGQLDQPVMAWVESRCPGLDTQEIDHLNRLLVRAREGEPQPDQQPLPDLDGDESV